MFSANPDGPLTRRRFVRGPGILVAVALAILASACAPGASVAPSVSTAPSTPTTPAVSASAEASPSASAAAGARLRDRSGRPERLLRDRLRSAVQAVRGVHQAVPERDLEHQRGPVRNLISTTPRAARGRQPAGPDPPADDGLAGQGRPAEEPRRLRHRVRLGQVAGRAARAEPCRHGWRPRGAGSLYALGLNYSLTGVFYNKKLADADRHDRSRRRRVAEFEDLLAKAKAAGLQPIMQWNAAASGGGLAFPLQNLMAAYGEPAPINDWIFQKPGATIDTPTNLTAAQHLEQWIKAGYFPKDVNAIDYTDANAPLRQGRGRVHVQRRLGERRPRQGDGRQRRLLPLPAGDGRRTGRGDVGAADLRHRRQGQERGLRRVLPQLGGHQRRPRARST